MGKGGMPDTTNAVSEDLRDGESIGELFTRLKLEAKIYARAEVSRVRALIFRRMVRGRLAILFMVSAALLTQSAVLVLLVGALLALAPHMGIVVATIVVTLVALVVAGVMARLAFWQVKRMVRASDETEDDR